MSSGEEFCKCRKTGTFAHHFFQLQLLSSFALRTAKYGKLQFWSESSLEEERVGEKKFILQANNRESDDTNGYNPTAKKLQ